MRARIVCRSTLALLCFAATALVVPDAGAACLDAGLTGVNLAGAEFNAAKQPGVLNKDYVYPGANDLKYFSALGNNTIRLPFLWERVQPVLKGPLDAKEIASISAVLDQARQLNLCVILDVHNYGTYRGKTMATADVPVDAFADLWVRLAAQFPEENFVAFDLMNEPVAMSVATWADTAKHTLSSIRKSGAKNLVLIAGGRWSGVHDWEWKSDGASNALALADVSDPLHRTLIEVHQYADADFSGARSTCIEPDRLSEMFTRLTQWARTNRQQLFLGEFGVPANPVCLNALKAMLTQTRDKTIWRGWTYWAAGAWWGNYPLSIQPRNGQDAPQMVVLRDFLKDQHP